MDSAVLQGLREAMGGAGDPMYVEAITSFLEESKRHLHALQNALTRGHADSIRREAHILKGSSGYFGAHRIQALSLTIESLAQANQLSGIAPSVRELQDEFRQVRKVLTKEAGHGPA